MLLSFPTMHPSLFAGDVKGVRFFDPGYADSAPEGAFRPEDLPLDSRSARALINDSLRFGEQFKDPGEMAYFGAQTADDYFEGSSMSIQAQLTRSFDDGQGSREARERREAACKAQFVLLLAWFFEENMMEVQSIEQGVKHSWESMDRTLGMDDEDRLDERVVDLGTAESHTGGKSDGQQVALPWRRIIEALPAFIPQDTALVCCDSEIIEAWEELEIEFVPAASGLGLPQGARVATLPAWRFAGRRKPPEAMPQALSDVTVVIIN